MTIEAYNKMLEEIYQRFPSFQVVGDRAFKPGLGNMLELDRALGFPSKDFKTVHVAGTNGKGSVSHMIAAALMQLPGGFVRPGACKQCSDDSVADDSCASSGHIRKLRVGLYTSPHLVDFRERIKVDGRMVEKEWVYNFLKDNKELFEKTDASFFEITTAMAFSYFSYRNVDIAVMECGLGGRLDSTNIITPEACVITNIGFDHMQYLGNTLEEIASEKAGIIKPGIPVVIGEVGEIGRKKDIGRSCTKDNSSDNHPDGKSVERVFVDKASDCSTDIYFAEKLNPYNLCPDGVFRSFSHRDIDMREETLKSVVSLATCLLAGIDTARMDLKGDCQKKNIKTVCMALAVLLRRITDGTIASIPSPSGDLGQQGGQVSAPAREIISDALLSDIVDAVENAAHITGLRGRWEKLKDNPLIICDIGHNAHGMRILMPQVERTFKDRLSAHTTGKQESVYVPERNQKPKEPRLIMFFGVMKDKDLASEVEFLPKDATYVYVNASTPRALPASELKAKMDGFGFKGEVPEDGSISAGLKWIEQNAKEEDFVFIGGSSYVVAEVLEIIDD